LLRPSGSRQREEHWIMKNKKRMIYIGISILFVLLVGVFIKLFEKDERYEIVREVKPVMGDIRSQVSTMGTVQPQNRLEVKPPVNGRIDRILVKEGDRVRKGRVLVWMSSTERAVLLDAARSQGKDSMSYWEGAYKPTSLIAPINGEVIVRAVEPGQTVSSNDAVIVLSDRLIVKAQLDETDIGSINVGNPAVVSLDAYPDVKIKAIVDHISYESTVVNNVTMYEVDVVPSKIPERFRSGMSANVDIITDAKEKVLMVPLEVVTKGRRGDFVFVKEKGKNFDRREVVLGLSDDQNVEIISGITEDDILYVVKRKESSERDNGSSNPLNPFSRRRRR